MMPQLTCSMLHGSGEACLSHMQGILLRMCCFPPSSAPQQLLDRRHTSHKKTTLPIHPLSDKAVSDQPRTTGLSRQPVRFTASAFGRRDDGDIYVISGFIIQYKMSLEHARGFLNCAIRQIRGAKGEPITGFTRLRGYYFCASKRA